MEMSFFASVLPWFRGVGVSKRRTQAGTLVLRLMGRCVGLKRPCTGSCLEGRAKKDISMLFSIVSFLGELTFFANGQKVGYIDFLWTHKRTGPGCMTPIYTILLV